MISNHHGTLAVHANENGAHYGQRLVDELNKIIREECPGERELKLNKPKVTIFPNTMLNVSLEESVRDQDAFLVQWFPRIGWVDELSKLNSQRNAFEFFYAISALCGSGVERLTLVTPYVYDQRKDTREGRDVIGAKVFAQLLESISPKRTINSLCLDIHSQPVVGYYRDETMDSVPMFTTYVNYMKANNPELLENAVVLLPDEGSTKRGRVYSELTHLPRIKVEKVRLSGEKTKMDLLKGEGVEIAGKKALLFDDILGTGSTAAEPSEYLKNRGVAEVYWFMTHPEITNLPKLDDFYKKGLFNKIFIADTVPPPNRDYFVQIPTAPLVARMIYRLHAGEPGKGIGEYLER